MKAIPSKIIAIELIIMTVCFLDIILHLFIN